MAELPRTFGKYALLKALGAGGTSDVFLARPLDPRLGVPSPLVIKRLHGVLSAQEDFYGRFEHEAKIATAVRSPHLPRVYEIGRVDDTAYIAMEYLNGWTVARLIQDLQSAGKQASIASVADVISGALAALHALHTAVDRETGASLAIVHRDIAPRNVMVAEDGITRLIDFGLGKSTLKEWKTETGVVLGTPGYMAPEQVHAQTVDQRADIYAMGIVLFELLTLRLYIRRGPVPLMLRAQASPQLTPPSELRADVPRALDEVVKKALAIDPAARFQTAREFHDALREAVPRDEARNPLPTLVGQMLWSELDEEKSEVTQLLNTSGELEDTGDGAGKTMTAATDVVGAPTTIQPVSFAAPPAPGGVPVKAVLLLVGMTLVLGVMVGFALRDPKRPVAAVTAESVAGAAAPVAQPAPSAMPAATPARESEVGEEPAKTREVRPSRSSPSRGVRREEVVVEKTVAAVQSGRDRANTLIVRAKALKSKLEVGSAAEKEATGLIGKLLMEASSPEVETARLDALESELARLEHARE